jgi:hypothetical protein
LLNDWAKAGDATLTANTAAMTASFDLLIMVFLLLSQPIEA